MKIIEKQKNMFTIAIHFFLENKTALEIVDFLLAVVEEAFFDGVSYPG